MAPPIIDEILVEGVVYYSPATTARLVSRTISSVYNMCRRGELRSITFRGRSRWIKKASIDRYLQERASNQSL
jgi:hypothetical protein